MHKKTYKILNKPFQTYQVRDSKIRWDESVNVSTSSALNV